MELLVDSGELRKVNSNYQPTGLALKTLQDSEEQDRKHNANIRVQVLLAILAVLSVVMAASQAGLVKLPTLLDLRGEGQQLTVPAKPSLAEASRDSETGLAAKP